ncbi:unnamed protein product, partial [Ixodes pacificus]
MARLHAAEDIAADHITTDEPSGIFHVQGAAPANASYLVQFSTPSCSCPDFQKTRLPCKHFFAIFLHIQDWCFDRLPASYRNGPLMSLDSLTVTDVAVATPSESCGHVAANVSEECNATDIALPDLERREKLGIGALKAKVLAEFERGKSLSYYCTSQDNLNKVLELLGECSSLLQEGTPSVGGLGLRGSPTKGCSGQRKRQSGNCSVSNVSELKRH